ncbi:MAG: PH domain-containing protein [Yaniella sp.]|uniref:PH domain-containing protein n=1 Tax=Yaniella sp. TaxID=2773929 RepID=UPI002647425D|nr:PH domain-containing protein [Yaniella sp.]MDN5705069.1 PH domain-containing protein [Yaniella sp.]MDN5731331.1 PH domain-containing protein [Yaniella sp.]MDN5814999.1 PH domain-containing protein [Yaniella sp.]MDN5817841.1 PH domain-containing protein [Yaniella sp.]MDN5838028.1 PH domain-containing protein [Yaniella sp.]
MAWTPAQQSFLDAQMRNAQGRGARFWAVDKLLPPEEIVYDYLTCTLKSDSFPLLMVTNRRVLYTERKLFRGWVIASELPAYQVAGASYEQRWITGRVHVHGRDGSRITCKVRLGPQEAEWIQYMVTLINQLATGRGTAGH